MFLVALMNILGCVPSVFAGSYTPVWTSEHLYNGGFESSTRYTDWTATSEKQSDLSNTCVTDGCGLIILSASNAHLGDYTGFLGGVVDRYETLTSSSIQLDNSADRINVSYYYRIYTQEVDGEDTFRVAVYDETDGHSEAILVENNYTSDDISNNAWLSDSFDLTGFVENLGVTTVKIKIFGWNSEDSEYSSFFIDDVSVLGSWGDVNAPTSNTISINSGALATNSATVTLGLFSTDSLSGVEYMRFSNDGTSWSGWYDYATTKSWVITHSDYGGSASQGTKTVYVEFKDKAGNASSAVTDTILYDSKAPVGSIKINKGDVYTYNSVVTLKLSATDSSGIQMRFSNNKKKWSTWQAYNTKKSNWKMTSATYGGTTSKGKKYVYVQFKDALGSVSSYSDYIIYR